MIIIFDYFGLDKTIKLWRITERHKRATGFNVLSRNLPDSDNVYSNSICKSNGINDSQMDHSSSSPSSSTPSIPSFRDPCDVKVPQYEEIDPVIDAFPKRIYANAHTYLINSLSVNSDQETFLSADDLRINLWNLEVTDQSFSIL